MAACFALFWAWMSVALAQDTVGGRLDESIVLDLTEEGLNQLGPAVESVIPSPIELPDFETSVFGLAVGVTDLRIDVQVDGVIVDPRPGAIDFDVLTTVLVNTQNDPAIATFLGADCPFYIEPFEVTATTTAVLSLVDDPAGVDFDRDGQPDTKRFDVTFGEIVVNDTATGDDIQTPNCILGSVNAILSVLGIDLFDLLLNAVRPQLTAIVTDLPEQIEPLLEEPIQGFGLAEEINLLGVPFYVALWPDSLQVDDSGVRIGFASFVDVPADTCVEEYGITDYEASTAALPAPPYPDSPVPNPHGVGFVEDDFANLSLYSAWAGGLLCLDLSDPANTFELPIALDSSLLRILAPDGDYDDLFEERSPLSIVSDPKSPPVVDLTTPDDFAIAIDPIGLVVEAEIAGRRSRVLDVEVSTTLGASLDFDGQTGALSLGLSEITEDRVELAVIHNDFAPQATPQVEASLRTLLTDVAAPLLDDQLADLSLSVEVPAFEGFGLQSLDIAPSASDGSVLGAYVLAGAVPYEGAGCADGGGCDQGCASSGGPGGATFGVLFALGLVLRRRHTTAY